MASGDRNLGVAGILADGHALRILHALREGPLTAQEIVARTGIPPAACYRRLTELSSHGLLVEAGFIVAKNGKKSRQFRANLARVQVSFEEGAFHVDLALQDGRHEQFVYALPENARPAKHGARP
jgi:DNA-binding transcriptional ArsR family regulator